MNLSEQRRYARLYLRWFARHQRRAYRQVRSWLAGVRDAILPALQQGTAGGNPTGGNPTGIPSVISRLSALVPESGVRQLLSQIYRHTLPDAAQREFSRLRQRIALPGVVSASADAGFFSAVWQNTTARMLADSQTAARITQIAESTRAQIRRILLQANAENVSVRETAHRISTALGGKGASTRAMLIARTETTRAANAGHEAGAMSTSLTLEKKWIATGDSRTRDAHRAMIGKKSIPKDDLFWVNGARMRYPGDPAGGAFNCVNCRCVIVYLPAGSATTELAMAGRSAAQPGRTPRKAPSYSLHADGTRASKSKTIEAAQDWAIRRGVAEDVNYAGLNPAIADRLNNQLYKLKINYNTAYKSIYPGASMNEVEYFKTGPTLEMTGGSLVFNPDRFNSARRATETLRQMAYDEYTNWIYDGSLEGFITHEYAHLLHVHNFVGTGLSAPLARAQWENSLSRVPSTSEQIELVSDYAKSSLHETQAEAFVFYQTGGRPKSLTELEQSVLKLIVPESQWKTLKHPSPSARTRRPARAAFTLLARRVK